MSAPVQGPVSFKILTTPANPPTGEVTIYPKADKKFYTLDETGAETQLGGSGGGGKTFAFFSG